MVDRKRGMDYEIRIDLSGFKDLRALRTELDKVRRGWRKLKTDIQRVRPEVKKLTKLQEKNALQQQKLLAITAQQNAKANIAIQRARLAQAKTEQQLLRNRFAHQKLNAEMDRHARKANKVARSQRAMRKELTATGSRANRVSFTFRRLFGIFAAFAAIRIITQRFGEAITSGRDFNAFVEQSRLGIQSLLAASAEVYGPDGILITGPEKFAALQAEAGRQTRLLEADARATAATFEQLVEAFQIGLGPGLRAGLEVDDIRRLARVVAQAAAAIGLPMNQLNEEIRSLLAGTITQRTTRIAAVLGITNEDIRRWTEAGTLAENLFKQFNAFELASSLAVQNFNVILTNLAATFRQVLGEGSLDSFQRLKDDMVELMDTLREGGGDTFANEVNNLLNAGLDAARELVTALDFNDAALLVRGIAETLRLGSQIASAMLKGVVAAAKIIKGVVSDFTSLLSSLGKAVGDVIGVDIASAFGRAVRFLIAAVVATKLLVSLTRSLVSLWAAINIVGFVKGMRAIIALTISWTGLSVRLLGIWRGLAFALVGPVLALTIIGFLISKLTGEAQDSADAAKELSAQFDFSSIAIRATSKALQDQVELVQKIVEETSKLKDQFSLEEAAKGLTGQASKFEKVLQKGLNETRERTKTLVKEEVAARKKLLDLEADRETIAARLTEHDTVQRNFAKQARDQVEAVAGLKKIVLDRSVAVAEAERAIAASSGERLEAAREVLSLAKVELREALSKEKILTTITAQTEDELKFRKDLLELASREFTLKNEIAAQEGQITSLVEGQDALRKAQSEKLILQLSILARQSAELSKQALLSADLRKTQAEIDLASFGGDKLEGQLLRAGIQIRLIEASGQRQIKNFEQQAARATRMAESLATAGASQEALSAAIGNSINAWAIVERSTAIVGINVDLARAKVQRLQNLLAIDKTLRSFSRTAEDLLLVKTSAQRAEATVRPFRNALQDAQTALADLPGTNAAAEIIAISNAMTRAGAATRALTQNTSARVKQLQRDADLLSKKFDLLGKDVLGLAEISKSRELALRELPQVIDKLQAGNTKIISQVDSILTALGLEEEIRSKIKERLLQVVSLGAKQRQTKDQIAQLTDAERLATTFIKNTLQLVVRLEARRLALAKERSNVELRAVLGAAKIEQGARGGNQTQQRQAQLQGELIHLAAQETILEKQLAINIAKLTNSKASAETEKEREAIEEAINQLLAEQALRLGIIEIKTKNITEDLNRIGDGTFGEGIKEGFKRATESIDLFETAAAAIETTIDGLAQIGADAIVNIFDADNFKDAGEALINLFKSVVASIIAEFLKIQIIKGLATIGFGVAKGGPISSTSRAKPSLMHAFAPGYGRGGPGLRPKGLDPRDRIPAWLRAGEWVITPEKVAQFRPLLQAMQRGLLDPRAANALAGNAGPLAPRFVSGYSHGGPVGGTPSGSDHDEVVVVLDSEQAVDDGISLEVGRANSGQFRPRRTLRNRKQGRL